MGARRASRLLGALRHWASREAEGVTRVIRAPRHEAGELGRNARKSTGNHLPVDERVGLDGKTRKLPQRTPRGFYNEPEPDEEATPRTTLPARAPLVHESLGIMRSCLETATLDRLGERLDQLEDNREASYVPKHDRPHHVAH
jgi:hypothetical protein